MPPQMRRSASAVAHADGIRGREAAHVECRRIGQRSAAADAAARSDKASAAPAAQSRRARHRGLTGDTPPREYSVRPKASTRRRPSGSSDGYRPQLTPPAFLPDAAGLLREDTIRKLPAMYSGESGRRYVDALMLPTPGGSYLSPAKASALRRAWPPSTRRRRLTPPSRPPACGMAGRGELSSPTATTGRPARRRGGSGGASALRRRLAGRAAGVKGDSGRLPTSWYEFRRRAPGSRLIRWRAAASRLMRTPGSSWAPCR